MNPDSKKPFTKKHAAVAMILLAIAGGGIAFRARHQAPVAETEERSSLKFVAGTTMHYTVAWSGTQQGRLFAEGMGAEQSQAKTSVDMALGMDLYVESVVGDEATLRLSFPSVQKHGLVAFGQEVFPSREAAMAALSGRSARIRIGNDGVPRDVAFQEGSPDIFMNVVQWVVAQSTVSLRAGREWDAAERGPFGRSDVHYSRSEGALVRTRTKYVSIDGTTHSDPALLDVKALDGKSRVELEDGLISRVHGEESIKVDAKNGGGTELDGKVAFDLTLVNVDGGGLPAGAIAYGPATKAGEAVIGDDLKARLLDNRAEGMTREQLLSDVATMGAGGTMPKHSKWLWRATGYLLKDPAACKELGKLALAPGATDKSRALVLDLLASVGHKEAQAEMRTILSSSELAKSSARHVLLQRVSFLDAPEAATVDTVWSSYKEGKDKGSVALVASSAHAIAAASRAQAKNGDASAARSNVKRLANEIESTKDKESKVAMLSALGNASSEDVVGVAKPYAASEDPEYREAAADSLRKVETRQAVEMLIALLGDANPSVQGSAAASLADRTLEAADWQRIADLVAAGRIGGALDGAMLNLASPYMGKVRVVSQIVAAIAARPDASTATRARAQNMLDGAPT